MRFFPQEKTYFSDSVPFDFPHQSRSKFPVLSFPIYTSARFKFFLEERYNSFGKQGKQEGVGLNSMDSVAQINRFPNTFDSTSRQRLIRYLILWLNRQILMQLSDFCPQLYWAVWLFFSLGERRSSAEDLVLFSMQKFPFELDFWCWFGLFSDCRKYSWITRFFVYCYCWRAMMFFHDNFQIKAE